MIGVLIKIAFRNLKEHKVKTIIIGILFMLGILVLVVGNSFTYTIQKGIEKNYIENYTGNIFVASSSIDSPSLIMPEGRMDETTTAILPKFKVIQDYVQGIPGVTGTTGQINGVAMAKWGDIGDAAMILFGVDSVSYQNLFSSGIKLIDGAFLKEGENGIVLSRTVADMFKESAGKEIQVGDSILLTAMNSISGTKVREVEVKGIHDYGDASIDLSMVCFLDQETLRILNGMILADSDSMHLTQEESSSLGTFDEESLFGVPSSSNEDFFEVNDLSSSQIDSQASDEEYWTNILGDTSLRSALNETNPDAWNYLLIKVADTTMEKRVIEDLNSYFLANGIEAKAWSWIDGAGVSATLANSVSIIFNTLVIIIAIVAVIVIMNTLVISVSERSAEIGTMRAIGAKKSFIRSMISLETVMITIVFGVAGILIGVIVLLFLGALGIEATNPFLQMLLGGDLFRPAISIMAIITSFVSVLVVGLIASLYPVAVALRTSPREAMNKG